MVVLCSGGYGVADSWEHIGSKTCAKACHLPSSAGNTVIMELATGNDENPLLQSLYSFVLISHLTRNSRSASRITKPVVSAFVT